jgi:hypothetical protein
MLLWSMVVSGFRWVLGCPCAPFVQHFVQQFDWPISGRLVFVPPSLTVPDHRSPLKSHINLLPPSLSCGGNRQLLRRDCMGQVKLNLGSLRFNYRTSRFRRFQTEGAGAGTSSTPSPRRSTACTSGRSGSANATRVQFPRRKCATFGETASGRADKGIIIMTGTFAAEARRESIARRCCAD